MAEFILPDGVIWEPASSGEFILLDGIIHFEVAAAPAADDLLLLEYSKLRGGLQTLSGGLM